MWTNKRYMAALVVMCSLAMAGCVKSEGNSTPGNTAPVASVSSATLTVESGDTVQLIGSATDAEGDVLTYMWTQTSGTTVTLSGASTTTAGFTAPQTDTSLTLVFSFTANDGELDSDPVSVTVTVTPPHNDAPVATVTSDELFVNSGDTVTLAGMATDQDNDPLTYSWVQVPTGTNVSLTNADAATATFVAPEVQPGEILMFEFSADDGTAQSNVVTVSVHVATVPAVAGPTRLYVSIFGTDTTDGNEIRELTEVTGASMNYQFGRLYRGWDNRGIALDVMGDLMQVGDDGANGTVDDNALDVSGGVSTFCRMSTRPTVANASDFTFSLGDHDRNIRGTGTGNSHSNATGLLRPGGRGVTLIHEQGYVVVANFQNQNVRAFSTGASGNVAAVAATTLGAKPWDVAYDSTRDVLYVSATNGSVRVLDNYTQLIASGDTPQETRVFRIVDESGNAMAINLHGIAYEPTGDQLVVSDVGADTLGQEDGTFLTDGSIYVIDNVSRLNGDVQASIVITGADTLLQNPVDLVINGRAVIVADSAADKVMIFRDVFLLDAGTSAPVPEVVDIANPDSLAIEFQNPPARPAVSDIKDPSTPITSMLVTMTGGTTPTIYRLSPQLGVQTDPEAILIAGRSEARGLTLDSAGDGYLLAYDPGTDVDPSGFGNTEHAGTITTITRLAYGRTTTDGALFDARRDRAWTESTFAASAVDIDPANGLLYVANDVASTTNAHTLRVDVYSLCGTGTPIATVALDAGVLSGDTGINDPLTGGSTYSPARGIDYDPASGDLWVAMSDGNVAVFRDFSVRYNDYASGNTTAQIIALERQNDAGDGVTNAATALGGIRYISGTDTLIATDIGASGDATDGQILIMRSISAAGSSKVVDVRIAGPSSGLGDPVALAFDGDDLYVADAANDAILKFNGILSISGSQVATDVSPSASSSLADIPGVPASIVLVPDYLSQAPSQKQ